MVINLREGGDDRGSPLTVTSDTWYEGKCLNHTSNTKSTLHRVPFSGGLHKVAKRVAEGVKHPLVTSRYYAGHAWVYTHGS